MICGTLEEEGELLSRVKQGSSAMVIVLVGPMGCGKTTIGKVLSQKMGWSFEDADDFHPESNKTKMAAGIPLDDDDRTPWLEILHNLILDYLARGENLIVACSALKRKYRRALGIDQKEVVAVFLQGTQELLQERIGLRDHEYMNRDLLQSQLDTLEIPEGGIIVDIADRPDFIADQIQKKLSEQNTNRKI